MSKRVDPAVAWLSSLALPFSPREFLLRQATELLSENGQATPPFDPRRAIPRSVKRVEITRLSRDGMLIPVDGGFVLKLNSQRPPVRQRFACAHEIGHTFFYDLSGPRPWRPNESMSSYWAEEDLCYQFAEEMLMPAAHMTRLGGAMSPSLASFQELLMTFRVSAEALARRIRRLRLWRCVLVVMVPAGTPMSSPKRKVVYKSIDYKSCTINWDALLREAPTLGDIAAGPDGVVKSTLTVSDMFRSVKKDSQWTIECRGFPGAGLKTLVWIAVPTCESHSNSENTHTPAVAAIPHQLGLLPTAPNA